MGDFALAVGGGLSQGFAEGQRARQKLEQNMEELNLKRKQLDATVKLKELESLKLLQELQRPEVSERLIKLFEQSIGGGQAAGLPPTAPPIGQIPAPPVTGPPIPAQPTDQAPQGQISPLPQHAPAPPAPAPPGPRLTGPAGTGGFRLVPSLTTDEKGGTRLTFKAEPIEPKIGETTLFMGGQPMRMQVRTNPATGQVDLVPLGRGEPSAQTEQAMRIVSGFGIPEGHPMRDQFLNRTIAAFNLSPEIRDQELINIQKDATAVLGGQPSVMGDLGAARRAARLEEAEAAGLKTKAGEMGKQEVALAGVEAILGQLDPMVNRIFTEEPGLINRVIGGGKVASKLLRQDDADVVLYRSLTEGVLANLVRFFGERGTLTNQDIARARRLFPKLLPLPDTKEVARKKMQQIRSVIQEIERRPVGWKPPQGAKIIQKIEDLQDIQGGPSLTGPQRRGRFRID